MTAQTGAAVRIDLSVHEGEARYANGGFRYDQWLSSLKVPIYQGFFIEDLRTLELGWWEERGCDTAFIRLFGQEGVSEARVSELPAGEQLPPYIPPVDELVYVVSGAGVTTVDEGGDDESMFEWQTRSLFLLHHGVRYRHFNAQDKPTRLLHYNYLPIAMSAVPDVLERYSNDAISSGHGVEAARVAEAPNLPRVADGTFWYGNFFPDMAAWDNLSSAERRGAGGKVVFLGFPESEMTSHMSVFPSRTYKKAHRHGPGRSIVIPAGEGYSVLWQGEDDEKIIVPWHEGTLLTPPNRWFHQHFNVGERPARYLALHPLRQFSGHSEKVEDRERDEIDYSREEPWIREKFEAELAQRGLTSGIPPEAYTTPNLRIPTAD